MSLILYPKNTTASGIPAAPALDRPVTSLSEHVQTAMGAFFTIQENLAVNKRVPKEFLVELKEEKQSFISQCENMQRVLQAYYRHAADYATFSQRAVDGRVPSAMRCLSSAKNVHRETQELHNTYQTIVTSLNKRRSNLSRYLKPSTKTRSSTLPATTTEQSSVIDRSGLHTLYSAVEGVQECIRDLIAFWDYHITSLASLIQGQSNFPSPGEEAKAIFGIWTDYQATLLQSSNSISASADALTVEPRVPLRRRDTFPTTRAEKAQHQDTDQHTDGSEGVSQFMYGLKNLTAKIVKPLRDFGKYIRTKVVGNEPNAA